MAEILNTNSASVFTIENLDTVPESSASPIEITPLETDNILEKEVQKYLDKLEVNKSTGPHYLSPRLLKELPKQVVKRLLAYLIVQHN